MSTSANLPAGFSITSISGVRCTAVPRTATTLSNVSTQSLNASTESTSTSAAVSTTTTSAAAQTTASSTSTSTSTSTSSSTSSTSTSTSTSTSESSTLTAAAAAVPAVVSTTAALTTVPPAAVSTSTLQSINATPLVTSTESSTTPASPASSSTITPATTPVPIALSDTLPSSTSSSSIDNPAQQTSSGSHTDGTVQSSTSAAAASAATTTITGTGSSDTSGSSSGSGLSSIQSKAAPVVGGVVGGMAGIAIIAFLFWFFRRRRNQRRRSTLLTPLGTGRGSTFYEIDKQSVGPTSRGTKWGAEAGWHFDKVGGVASGLKEKMGILGTSLRKKVVGPRGNSPSVNLNRGNSQFLEGQILQHSRTNSAMSSASRITTKDRFQDWVERAKENASFNWRLRRKSKEPDDPFETARGMTEKHANLKAGAPDFSQLLNMDDRELQLQAERRRASLVGVSYQSGGGLGSLGLGFQSSLDPFADPKVQTLDPFADPEHRRNSNPFADPITQPKATISKDNNYVADVRRSRGLSTDMTNRPGGTGIGTGAGGWLPPSTAPASRYPSTIAPSRDSYRDTVYSTFSSNARKGKGRSDPFDLERLELWRKEPIPAMPQTKFTTMEPSDSESILVGMERESAVPNASSYDASKGHQRNESTNTYGSSKYSSGVSLGGFGDPGPDVGPGSGASSLRNGNDGYGSLTRSDSTVSDVSSTGGVGKAR